MIPLLSVLLTCVPVSFPVHGAAVFPAPAQAPSIPTNAPKTMVLVPGNPELTKGMTDNCIQFLAFLLETPLTVAQKDLIYREIISGWKKKDSGTISFVDDFNKLYLQVMQKTDAERDFVRKSVLPELLKTLRQNPNDEGAKWIMAIYNAGHKPIAAGNPALTRQMTDAYTEIFFFMASEVIGEKYTPSTQAKNSFATMLAKGYSQTSAEEKATISKMPLLWSAIRVAWPEYPEEQKKAARVQWAKDLGKLLPPAPDTPLNKTANATTSTAATAGKSSGLSASDYRKRMAALNNMNNAYQQMNKMMWENHYRQSNIIATWGNSSYRYVNSYGNPY